MKILKLTGFLLAASVLMMACGKKGPEYTRYIPKEASYVVAMDIKSMMTKLAADSLTVENMLDVLKKENNQEDYTKALEMWKQFKDAGLDWENKVLVAIPTIDLSKGNVAFELVAGLKDEKKLADFIAKLPNAPKVNKDGDISFANLGPVSIGWNKTTAMIAGNEGMHGGMEDLDSTNAAIPGSEGSKGIITKYFNLKKDESLASVKELDKLLEQKADVAIYTNSSNLSNPAANPFLAMMPKVKELLDGVYSTSIVNFEDGKITMESHSYAGSKLADLLKKYAGPEVDLSLAQRYPSANVNGVAAFSFKPELIPAFLKETGLDALANLPLTQSGSNVDEIAKAFKGDFAVVFSDFSVQTKDMGKDASYKSYEPTGKLVVAVRIGDKAAFDKLIGLVEKQGFIRRQGNRIMPLNDGEVVDSKLYAGVENDLLIFATDSTIYANYVANRSNQGLNATAQTALKGQSIGFYVNAESILKGIPADVFDTTSLHERNILNRSKDLFKDMWFNSANFDGKQITSKGEVTLTSSKNSLPQLVRYLMFIADEMKLKEKEEEAMYNSDESNMDNKTHGDQ